MTPNGEIVKDVVEQFQKMLAHIKTLKNRIRFKA